MLGRNCDNGAPVLSAKQFLHAFGKANSGTPDADKQAMARDLRANSRPKRR